MPLKSTNVRFNISSDISVTLEGNPIVVSDLTLDEKWSQYREILGREGASYLSRSRWAQSVYSDILHSRSSGRPISILAAPDVLNEMPDRLSRIRRGERVDHRHTGRRPVAKVPEHSR